MTYDPKDSALTYSVADGKLTISIDIGTLAWATVHECENRDTGIPVGTNVIDAEQFAKDVLHELQDEREDGSTLVTDLLDRAAFAAFENGSMGLDYLEQMPDGYWV